MTRQSSLLSAQDRAMLNLRAHLVFNGAKQSDLHISQPMMASSWSTLAQQTPLRCLVSLPASPFE